MQNMEFNKMEERQPISIRSYYTNPISLDLIEQNLYLGNLSAAQDIKTLCKQNITHILTLDVNPLPKDIQNKLDLATLHIPVMDMPNEDMIAHFDDAYNFINEGTKQGAVLVHCFFGISRSPTIIIAFLMKKYNYTFRTAYKNVKEKRSMINPNPGFVWQLQQYYNMNCIFNKNQMQYKIFRLKNAAEKIKQTGVFPLEFLDLIKQDPEVLNDSKAVGFRCKKCRRFLVSENNLVTHLKPNNEEICTESHFVEPLMWMEGVTKVQEGKLNCPKCNHKVGIFSWIADYQCLCGCIVTPTFLISYSDVYWSNSISKAINMGIKF